MSKLAMIPVFDLKFHLIAVSYFVLANNQVIPEKNKFINIIDTDGCKIPAFPLVSEDIAALVAPPRSVTPNCSATVPLLDSNSSHIWVIKPSLTYFGIFDISEFSCCYRNFSTRGNIENVGYGLCLEFSTAIRARHEFVRVECTNGDSKIYDDIFKFKIFNTRVKKKHDKKSFNILMLGLDGMSRKNFLRTMPRTSHFLRYRSSVQMHGYNKIGDNSMPNLIPIVLGMSYQEAKKVCWKDNKFHSRWCTFLWDKYKNAGYYTALGTDSGAGLLGQYEMLLQNKPTDFYLQPFIYEARFLYKDKSYDYHMCLQNRYVFKELLKYIDDVTTHVRRDKLFGLFWEESVSHGHLNYPYIMDDDYVALLNKLETSQYLQNTIVIFFSDHGARIGQILMTEQGRQESRLPLFEILLPLKFRHRYRIATRNLELNSHVLTTPQDVYATLLDLIDTAALDDRRMKQRIPIMNPNSNGISLFLPIPSNRTCKSLGIDQHWCTCLPGEKVAVSEKGKQFIAKYLLLQLNNKINEYPECHKLSIKKIVEVTGMKNTNDRTTSYQVLMQTSPGDGLFEATLLRDHNFWTVSGSISRLNLYGDQSKCIKDPDLKMYCYCKK